MFGLLKRAPARFMKSFSYCRDAVMATFTKEESFRLEAIGFLVLAAVMIASPWPWWKVTAMAASYLLIPLVEIVNSAIEDLCDLITRDHNPLIKNAKDKGALAVLFAIVFNAFTLLTLLLI